MNEQFLIEQLENIENAKRENRLRIANLVLENKELFPFLINITFECENKISIKAAWILEFVCIEKLEWIIPYLDFFTENIKNLKFDSAVRPNSKICNFLAIAYNSRKQNQIQESLSKTHIDAIIETGFDWMISSFKVATKAYAMNFLFLLGKNYDWVHEELKLIIEQNMMNESAAYKARGKITLQLIKKK